MTPRESLQKSLNWFETSGIMTPADGSGGVAERLVITENNQALEKINSMFPLHTEKNGYWIMEHRRADCCFETALLFLLSGEKLQNPRYTEIGKNILYYLFEKNDMRRGDYWNWYTPLDRTAFWFDDNGWVAAIEIFLGTRYPELEERYHMAESGRRLTEKMRNALLRVLKSDAEIKHGRWPDKEFAGEARQPHWGVPVCAALLMIGDIETVKYYYKSIACLLEKFGTSEKAYAFLGAALATNYTDDPEIHVLAKKLFDELCAVAEKEAMLLPSEHCEAPAGGALADLIYTQNWFFAALALYPDGVEEYRKLRKFLIAIQDSSGCWRGMFDTQSNSWGGGNCYEGGAGSIYSGWTNTVIALAMLKNLDK